MENPSRSVTLLLLNLRSATAAGHWNTAVAFIDTVMSGDSGATPLADSFAASSVRVNDDLSVRSSHRLDFRPSFTYLARFDQFLGLGIDFGLPDPIYDLKSDFQVQLPIRPIV
ncbi:hypothetical protein PVK06_043538 [Gossypium arboreum]|uniref:Uncharacterized protein n=1 Tax=Gossypium arboreum TaxID=29729 RepID=A0ABR0MQH3_GOSAR|nr:hypothetical protein PVK06_043538 [Gossypium arboreum]